MPMLVRNYYVKKAISGDVDALFEAFDWSLTPQGGPHWADRCYGTTPLSDHDITYLRGLLEQEKR